MNTEKKWQRFRYLPLLPLGEDGKIVTGSREHIALSRMAAAEGMVLLKNEEKLLPLAWGSKVALFGKASVDYVKGGGGSGDTCVAYVRNLCEAMKEKEQEGKVEVFAPLCEFYQAWVEEQYAEGRKAGQVEEPSLPETLLEQAARECDTAVISICRYSSEGSDRKGGTNDGDFYLSLQERKLVEEVRGKFERVVVVLNVGGMVDSSWFYAEPGIQSVLLAWQGGMEGACAEADILCGDVNPSGKLADTLAGSFDDYPSSYNFNESDDYVCYTDDIFVGYRYFETIPGAGEKVNYPFGFGLSYTSFEIKCTRVCEADGQICIRAEVTNTGERAGKEVVQVYTAPRGCRLDMSGRELRAFAKTELLASGESESVELSFPLSALGSYDEKKAAYVLQKGEYEVLLGNSVRNTERIYSIAIEEEEIIQQVRNRCVPKKLPCRLKADGTYEQFSVDESNVKDSCVMDFGMENPDVKFSNLEGAGVRCSGIRDSEVKCSRVEDPKVKCLNSGEPDMSDWPPRMYRYAEHILPDFSGISVDESRVTMKQVLSGEASLDDFLAGLTDDEVITLASGTPNRGPANTRGFGGLEYLELPAVMTADGPAGLHIKEDRGVKTTAFPVAVLLACTWDTELMYRIGAAGAKEVKENNMGVWLTPAVNIHRTPLCGRNFEYYSEDPLLAGKMAAAMVRGIQSEQISACVKHFCANNKETNRKFSDSRVSERALREIYLKPFETVVKESGVWCVMTAYNLVNGVYASERVDLIDGILREEWGYDGLVISDWRNEAEPYREYLAGNDVKMPHGSLRRVKRAMEEGLIQREDLLKNVRRMLELLLKLE